MDVIDALPLSRVDFLSFTINMVHGEGIEPPIHKITSSASFSTS